MASSAAVTTASSVARLPQILLLRVSETMIRIRSFHGASWALLLLFICVALDGTNAFLYPSAVRLLQWRKSSSIQRFSSTSSSSSSSGESSATQRLTSTTPSTPPQLQRQRRDFEIRPLFSSLVTAGNNSSSNNNNKSTWMSTIQGISNVASVLCVLDCTVLPLLTLTLPLVGWWSGGPGLQHTLCVWSHHLALYFVLPLGSFMSLWNYYMGGHSQKTAILSLAWGGLLLIGITNAPPESILTACSSSTKVTMVLEALHHGMWHRIVNLVGCAMLLGSNYLAQLLGCNCGLVLCVPKKKQQQNLLLQVTAVQQQQQQQTKMMIPYKYHQQQRMILPPLNDDPTTTTTNNKDKDVEGEDVGSTRSLKNL